jgi:hypothetical protein
MEIWPKPFSFPKDLKSLSWAEKVALEQSMFEHNKTAEINTSESSPSHVFSPEEIQAHIKKKAEKKKEIYDPIVVPGEDIGLLKSLGIDVEMSPNGRFVDKSVVKDIEFEMQPEAIKDAEERFGNIL